LKNMIVKRDLLKKLTSRTVSIAASLAVLANCTAPTARAWMGNSTENEIAITGSIRRSYFERGTGTSENPYVIARPIQLYYFAWLQDLGMFNVDNDNDGDIDPVYFELGDMNDGTTVNSIDMTGYSIPPIGTTQNPFLGNFNGNGKTISNVTVSNESQTDAPSNPNIGNETTNAQIIGFFGVVGGYGNISGPAANSVSNLILDDVTIHNTDPDDDKALVGIAVGYMNASVTGVSVSDSRIELGNGLSPIDNETQLSKYTIVGDCSAQYLSSIDISQTSAANPGIEYSDTTRSTLIGNVFGGSIDMKALHSRLNNIFDIAASQGANDRYVSAQKVLVDEVEGTEEVIDVSETVYPVNPSNSNVTYITYASEDAGSYLFSKDAKDSDIHRFMCLYGPSLEFPKTVTTYTKSGNAVVAYYITDGNGHYLNRTAKDTVSVGAVLEAATKWIVTNDHHLLTYPSFDENNNNSSYSEKYLNYSNGSFSISNTASTEWHLDGNGIYTTISGHRYCLEYDNGFALVYGEGMAISDGNGNYLKYSNGSISNTTNSAEATYWRYSSTDGTLYIKENGATQYLGYNGQLAVGNTQTSWTNDNGKMYCTYNAGTYYIDYNSQWDAVEGMRCKISETIGNITYYLNINAGLNGIESGTNGSAATQWYAASDHYYTVVNGTRYYLTHSDDTLTVVQGNYDPNSAITYSSNVMQFSDKRYIAYKDGAWTAKKLDAGFYIKVYNSNYYYLTRNNTSVSNATSQKSATVWAIDDSHRIYTIQDNVYYYLTRKSANSADLSVTSNVGSAYTWNKAENKISCTIKEKTYYLRYYGYWSLNTSDNTYSTVEFPSSSLQLPQLNITSVSSITTISGSISSPDITSQTTDYQMTKTVESNVRSGRSSWLPLAASETSPFTTSERNTGYIVSGDYASYQGEYGDVRISRYEMSSIEVALNQQTYASNKLEVLTRTAQSNGLKRVSDQYNSSNSSVNSSIRYYAKSSYSDLGLVKYKKARQQLDNVLLSDTSNIYGMHFMDAVISMQHLTMADKVTINGEVYYNYEMPEDSIDFQLTEQGYINFFAGTYYNNKNYENNSFFSLSKIERDANNKITAIKGISKIYGNISSNDDFVYEYKDGTTSESTSGLPLLFDLTWIENPTIVNNAVYYYEIPVNEGEYALGSVENKYGAYLMYLDIGANAQNMQTSIISEQISKSVYRYYYPSGVQFTANAAAFSDAGDSFTAEIPAQNYSPSYDFSRTGNAITCTASSVPSADYLAENLTYNGGRSADSPTSGPTATKYVTLDIVNKTLSEHIIVNFVQPVGGTVTNTYKIYALTLDANDNIVSEAATPSSTGTYTDEELERLGFVYTDNHDADTTHNLTYRFPVIGGNTVSETFTCTYTPILTENNDGTYNLSIQDTVYNSSITSSATPFNVVVREVIPGITNKILNNTVSAGSQVSVTIGN